MAAGAALQEEILEWDVVEFAAYGKERVGIVLKVDVPSSACVVQPLVREESGLWLENADVAATEVNLTTVRVCLLVPTPPADTPIVSRCILHRSEKEEPLARDGCFQN